MAIYKDGRLLDRSAIQAARSNRRPPRFLVEGIPSAFDGTTESQRVEARRPPAADYGPQYRYMRRKRLERLFAKVADAQ